MAKLDYAAFDADNHYYEAEDAFTRHLDPRLGPRTVQWAEIGGRKYHVVAGRVSTSIAAELGTMRVTEQVDALEAMVIDPIWYLAAPRFFAGANSNSSRRPSIMKS